MENKEELEKLVDSKLPCPNSGCDGKGTIAVRVSEDDWEPQQCQYCYEIRIPALELASLADKQGYMRALKEVEEALPKYAPQSKSNEGMRKYFSHNVMKGFQDCLSQAHEAITKLKDGV